MSHPCRKSELYHAFSPQRRNSLGHQAAGPIKFIPNAGEYRIGLRMYTRVGFVDNGQGKGLLNI